MCLSHGKTAGRQDSSVGVPSRRVSAAAQPVALPPFLGSEPPPLAAVGSDPHPHLLPAGKFR